MIAATALCRGSLARAGPAQVKFEAEMHTLPFAHMEARSGQPDRDSHFLHTNVFLRHASGSSGEAERYIETILTQAAVAKRRVWVSSILFAQLLPSMFVPGRFRTLEDLTRYIRSLATLVTPDPNAMLRVARLRDAKWQRPAEVREADEKPRTLSFGDAIEIASALWVKEPGGVTDLKFLMFDDWGSAGAGGGGRLSLLRLQDYAQDALANPDVRAAVRLMRVEPVLAANSMPQSAPAG